MNSFGGNWTENKIEILVKYAKAYLTIMKDRSYWKLLYFDGFAGSGFIVRDTGLDNMTIIGAARRIIEIDDPRPFDCYYFVELDEEKARILKQHTKDILPKKKIDIAIEDCNKKILDLAKFLQSTAGNNYRVLAYIDPCGMQLNWTSLTAFANLNVDIWILIPTGLGVNRLLTKSGNISEAWLKRLENFLGL
ncbi:MAG: three-Cys-motif partner protein TcmP, partial [Bacillota bacterium]